MQKQWKCNLGITWGARLHTCFTPLVSQSSLNSLSSWKNFTPFFFGIAQHVFLKPASKSFFRFTEEPGVPGRNIWPIPTVKLHFVPEGPAVQINLLLLLEFIPRLLSQSGACYDLTQPCKSLGIGLPRDKRSLSFSKLWLDQHLAKSDDRQRGQA